MLKNKPILRIVVWLAAIVYFVTRYGIPWYQGHKATEEVSGMYQELANDNLGWDVVEYSTQGHPIYQLVLGDSGVTTLLFGGFHGDEPGGVDLVIRLARYLSAHPGTLTQRVVIVPVLNPDALLAGTRVNANKVDINRNFPTKDWSPAYTKERYFPGPEPASEKETAIAMQLIDRWKPERIISIHSDLHVINYNGPSRELALRMARYNHYPIDDDIGYPTPGSFGTYAGEEMGIPTITLELPPYNPEEAWKNNRDALIAAINMP
ncbi:MAG: hypothetical protein D6677_02060 [Calditrichaeota bacterium]|nr:MAG: hypothetical protein D6677_02060 [Calditrichota bacterium]